MKIFNKIIISLFLFSGSCKPAEQSRNEKPLANNAIVGLWEGTYKTDQVNHDATYVSFAIYPDGTFLRRSKLSNAEEFAYFKGSWQISRNTFQFKDTTLLYSGGVIIDSGSAIITKAGALVDAAWQDVSGQPYTGTFQNLKRIQ